MVNHPGKANTMTTATHEYDTHSKNLINDYLKHAERTDSGELSRFTILCFVGMIETGEATYADLIEVAGGPVARRVGEAAAEFDPSGSRDHEYH